MKRIIRIRARQVILIVVILIVICAGGFFALSDYFLIKEVVLVGDKGVLQNLSNINIDQNIFLLDTSDIADRFKKNNPLTQSIVVKKKFPNSIEISFEERIPVIALATNNGYFYLDKDAFILSHSSNSGVFPVLKVSSIEITDMGDISSTKVKKGIQIVLKTVQAGLSVSLAEVSQEKNEITLWTNTSQLIVPISYNPEILFSSLQLLLRQFKIEGKKATIIDFRFNKPVVQFN